jgi:glycosyltransferase involved in cell wall biosynthesis
MKKIKIAIIRPFGNLIDIESYNCQELGLAKSLAQHGVDVDIFMAGGERRLDKIKIDSTGLGIVHVYKLPFLKIPIIEHAVYPGLKKILVENNYDMFHVNEENEITSFLIALLARRIHVPMIIYQGMYKQIEGRSKALFQNLYDHTALIWLKHNIHLAIAKTSLAELHLKSKGFSKTEILPVGLDVSKFDNSQYIDWKKRFNIKNDGKIVLYVGAFEKRRNIKFILELAKKFNNIDGVYFVLVGGGPEFSFAEKFVFNNDLRNTILAGYVQQLFLPSLYDISSIFLLPSEYEIYGMVALESMFFGVPVISTRTAGPIDIIDDNINGYLIDGIDFYKWEEKIRFLLSNDMAQHEMSNMAKKKIERNLTWDMISYRYLNNIIKPLQRQ